MPNPKAIDVPKLGFSDAQTEVLNIMMNKEERDYSKNILNCVMIR